MKKSITILLLFIMLFSIPVHAAKDPYNQYRKKHNVINHQLVDIDRDGTKEMLFLTYGETYGVCTVKNNRVVKLASMKLGDYCPYVYYTKGKFSLLSVGSGKVCYKVYKLKNGKTEVVQTIRFKVGDGYYINGKMVSEAEFENAYRAILKWKKVDLTGKF